MSRICFVLLLVAGPSMVGPALTSEPSRLSDARGAPPSPSADLPARWLKSCDLRAGSRRVRQGDVALVVLRCDTAPQTASVSLAGAPLLLFPFPESSDSGAPGNALAALVGIDVAASVGTRKLLWNVKLANGGAESGALALSIEPRDFPTQRIQVGRRFDELDAKTLTRTAEEQRRMLEVLGRRSPDRLWAGLFAAPVPGSGSGFGSRRIVNGRSSSPHSGLDIGASVGTPVLASNAGIVALADTLFFAGGTVILDHGLGLFTVYSHLSEISVSLGQHVEKGQPIAHSGATGRVTGPHLHWAVKLAGARVDPTALQAATGAPALATPAPLDTTPRGD